MTRTQRGFGAIMAIIVLVILAGLSAAILRVSAASQIGSALDMEGARAMAAANAGLEYGIYRALKPDGSAPWATCSCPDPTTCTDKTTLDLTADTNNRVLVWCDSTVYYVGPDEPGTPTPLTQRVLTITALACNASSCPDATAATSLGYIERKRVASMVLD